MQNHPLRLLVDFLKREKSLEEAKKYSEMRFVGYVLEIGYDTVTIITSDPFKIAVGGIPRNSLLIMVPAPEQIQGVASDDDENNPEILPPHFTVLRVLESAPTPLSKEVQQTYFELQKKSMPELDVFTQSELQWGALKTAVLGMFYPHPEKPDEVEFSGDLNNFVSAHKYRVYAPDEQLLDLMVNAMIPKENRFQIGSLRLTECRMPLPNRPQPRVPVYVSTKDFMGTRTAMFGKTRLGKSNIVKLIIQSLIETTEETRNVGQLIFDIDGEYANDNPQDGAISIRSAYSDRCRVYALTPKEGTPSEPLKLNFYEHPDRSHRILGSLLKAYGRDSSIYVQSFIGANIPSLEELKEIKKENKIGEYLRAKRRILMYWAILKDAGYEINENEFKEKLAREWHFDKNPFDPQYAKKLREKIYGQNFPEINNLNDLVIEFKKIAEYLKTTEEDDPVLKSSSDSGRMLFEAEERALLNFLNPSTGSGPKMLQGFTKYHHPKASDFVHDILQSLDEGYTVILDLSNADEELLRYYSDELSRAVLMHQVQKFTNNKLGAHYIQLYFEEAHNLFPRDEDTKSIYSRLAKEGAKYHIGMVYSTQSPSTINKDLLAQTENFFVVHLSSKDDINALGRANIAYTDLGDDLLRIKSVGYAYMLTRSHRFVVPMQADKFPLNLVKPKE